MDYERIDNSEKFDGPIRESHEERYRIAAKYVEKNDWVIDAGCGNGYGKKFFDEKGVRYWGIDKNPPPGRFFSHYDFEKGNKKINIIDFEVFVGLEVIEHLNDDGVKEFVKIAKQAKRQIIISTPIVENKNPYHKQQFSKTDIEKLFINNLDWVLEAYYEQDGIYGIFIFKKYGFERT